MCCTPALKLSTSKTMGTMPMMRLSTAPVNHVVAPRLEAPAVTQRPSVLPVLLSTNDVVASMALMADLAIGKYEIHSGRARSCSMYCCQVKAAGRV